MKPISIKISAFGPYKDEVVIDFTKFDDNGIFLITGDTGSGKTTIFDAICFALFGTASGSNRDKSSFRSDFASDDVKTFVILKFIHKGIIYKIERNPSYIRKKKRGDGFTQVSGDATLTYLNEVITGDKNATDKCIEILGINAVQFKQISMIAQGEFLKLLLAKPSERASIFRKIFDTYIYKDISDTLKIKYLETKRKYEDVGISIDNLVDSVILNEDINRDDINVLEFLNLVSKVICKDIDEEKKLEENKTNLANKIQNITSNIKNASLINDNFDKYETIINELKRELINQKDIDIKRELLVKNKNIKDKIIPIYDEVLRIEKLIKTKSCELAENIKLSKDVNSHYNEILDKYKNLDLERKKLDDLRLNLNEWERKLPIFLEIDELNKELDGKRNIYNLLKLQELNKISKKIEDNENLNNKYLQEKNMFILVKNEYNELSNKYNLLYNQFINCQAGIIAANLDEGCPCPVCGSLDHPQKATIDGDYITRDELDAEKEKLDICQKKLEDISSKVSILSKELELSNKSINEFDIDDVNKKIEICKNDIVLDVDVSKYKINDIEKDISYIKASIDSKISLIKDDNTEEFIKERIEKIKLEIKKKLKYIDDVNGNYDEISGRKTSIDSVIKVLEKEIEEFKKELEIKNKEYVDSYKKLGYGSEDDYLNIRLTDEKYAEYEDDVNCYDEKIKDLNSQLKALEEFIKDKKRIDISNLECDRDNKNVELSEIELSLKNIHSKINNNKIVYDKLNSVYKNVQSLEKELAIYEDLSNTANGNIKGKNKLEFEQYVQASYFDNVLKSANIRFSYMTDSRYLLARKIESLKISDKLGLELEVIDNYTGKRREITSLSGGESFKASLALALGMSDVIQSYSGGIVVETMFIDEGFGSLDSESLESAMNAIMMLSNNDRLIGIISHVNELKDRIDKKIIVKKSGCGSSVSVSV